MKKKQPTVPLIPLPDLLKTSSAQDTESDEDEVIKTGAIGRPKGSRAGSKYAIERQKGMIIYAMIRGAIGGNPDCARFCLEYIGDMSPQSPTKKGGK